MNDRSDQRSELERSLAGYLAAADDSYVELHRLLSELAVQRRAQIVFTTYPACNTDT